MIEDRNKSGVLLEWCDVPVATDSEALAEKAAWRFSAETTLSEKVGRVFNATMFFIVGLKLFTILPGTRWLASKISERAFSSLNGIAWLQDPLVKRIATFGQRVLFVVALALVIRKIVAFFIYKVVYPASIRSEGEKKQIDRLREQEFSDLMKEKFECRRIILNKSGTAYDAFAMEHETTKGNGRWALMAGGNGMIGEDYLTSLAKQYQLRGFNVLYVNGPGVGRSSGTPTSYSVGAGQEAGLQFLEKTVEAEKILMQGISLGGGAQADAIKSHQFNQDRHAYCVWSDRTFDTLSHTASEMVTKWAAPFFFIIGTESDAVGGAKRLQELGITHIVTQNSKLVDIDGALPLDGEIDEDDSDDGVIPNPSSLYVGIRKADIHDSDRLKCYGGPSVTHNGPLPQKVSDLVEAEIQAFATTP